MMNLTKRLFVLAFVFAAGTISFAQQSKTIPGSFVIVNNQLPEKADFYKKAIEAANMEQYRLRDARVHLEFENGFEVELYSAKELFVNDPSLNMSNYPVSHSGKPPVFGVLASGHLTAKVFTEEKK